MRIALVLLLLAPLSGCGLARAVRDSAMWRAEASKLQVENDTLKDQLLESDEDRLSCHLGVRKL